MKRTFRLLVAVVLGSGLPAQDENATPATTTDLASELTSVVDLPSPRERLAAAAALARLDATIDDWLIVMQEFGEFADLPAGEEHVEVPLWNGEKLEDTELFVYVSERYTPGTPAPLIVQAHGTGGTGRAQCGLWRGTADQIGAIVIAPTESGPNEGYGWSEREVQITLSAIRWARRSHDIDENRVFLSGISRGGHLTWDVALRHPDQFAGIAPMIGGPRLSPGSAQSNLRYLENIGQLPIRDLQGLHDDPLLIWNLRYAFRLLDGFGAADAQFVEFPELGHSFQWEAVDWVAFLSQSQRNPRPTRVVRTASRKDQARAAWVEIEGFDRGVDEEFKLTVDAKDWNARDEEGRRVLLAELHDRHTARLQVELIEPGRIEATSRLVGSFRLLLTPDMLDDKGKLAVVIDGKTKKFTPRPSAGVLLAEFVERFDRTFLPVAEVTVR